MKIWLGIVFNSQWNEKEQTLQLLNAVTRMSLGADFKCFKGAEAACPWNALSQGLTATAACSVQGERKGMHSRVFKGFMGHEIILLVKS